jgi:hypothetical protein
MDASVVTYYPLFGMLNGWTKRAFRVKLRAWTAAAMAASAWASRPQPPRTRRRRERFALSAAGSSPALCDKSAPPGIGNLTKKKKCD